MWTVWDGAQAGHWGQLDGGGGAAKRRLGHQLPCAFLLQVLLREPNPGVHFEFWLPRERYGPFQTQVQALGWPLRQPQPREVERQPEETPAVPEAIPARVASLAPGEAGTAVWRRDTRQGQGPSHSPPPP